MCQSLRDRHPQADRGRQDAAGQQRQPDPDECACPVLTVRAKHERSAVEATADLVDRHGEELSSIPVQSAARAAEPVAGPAVTVKCFEDNALLKSRCQVGRRIGCGPCGRRRGSLRCALVGDLIAGIALERGWSVWSYTGVSGSVALNELDIVKLWAPIPERAPRQALASLVSH